MGQTTVPAALSAHDRWHQQPEQRLAELRASLAEPGAETHRIREHIVAFRRWHRL